MITHNLGYPRIGNNRETKKALEAYWSGKISYEALIKTGKEIKLKNWQLQRDMGIDLIPSNDFSFYDHILDMSLTVGAIPERYSGLDKNNGEDLLGLYFAMARGYQDESNDITAMEMTKWFDTNYHYIVPEFYKHQKFRLSSLKFLEDFLEAKDAGFPTKPVLTGPVSYLLLGKEKEAGFDRIDLLENLLKVYIEMIALLKSHGVEWIQFDEPFLITDLSQKQKDAFIHAYSVVRKAFPEMKFMLATYFGEVGDNLETLLQLPVDAVHVDLVRAPAQLDELLNKLWPNKLLSLGIVDGRNIWKNDFKESLKIIKKAVDKFGNDRIMLAPSCSLVHVPCDLDSEEGPNKLDLIKPWLAFAKQKIREIIVLKHLSLGDRDEAVQLEYVNNQSIHESKKKSTLIHNDSVKTRLTNAEKTGRPIRTAFAQRKEAQQKVLNLPGFPTTTIGSFPQTIEIRQLRAKRIKGEISQEEYTENIRQEIEAAIRWQEEIGLDVLVHGEFERNDMVEYFGQMLQGFAFTKNGWVQSYGSRCVKPPIIFGDVARPNPMTVDWTTYAQSLTSKPVKGMLTGPVTILKWSFVRNDQPLSETCKQIALAVNDEVRALESAGIHIIQIDEPALREGLPIRKKNWDSYFDWAITAFRLSYTGVKDTTQIHTHMCYSEFNDIMDKIAELDADVISIESSRSQMEILDSFSEFNYPNDIGPGVYDIHSPRVPSKEEMVALLQKAEKWIQPEKIWINPDCGLKTRDWSETKSALINMIEAAEEARELYAVELS
jgi:5-methyltetrahydropteroyltriglutamate--homocysteine methyltransferase